MFRASVITIGLALAACSQAPGSNPSEPGSTVTANESAADAAPAAPAPTPTGAGATAFVRAELAGDGITYRGGEGAAPIKVSFGASEQDATGHLVTITGESTEYFDPNAAGCSTTSFGETSAYFQKGRFIGYSTSDKELKTAAGIGVGSTRAALEAAYKADFMQTEDGGLDFTIPGMRGVVQGDGPKAVIDEMAAGEICER